MAVDAILDEVDEWAERSGHVVVREDIRRILELSRDHLDRPEPVGLLPGDMEKLLLDVFPVTLELDTVDEAAFMVRAVRDLLKFLGETDRVPADRIEALTEELQVAEDEFVEDLIDGLPEEGELSLLQQLLAMLGLPNDQLPPVRLPPSDELAAAARTSPVLARTWDASTNGTDDENVRRVVESVEFDGVQRVWPTDDDELAIELWALATGALTAGDLDDPDEEVTTRFIVYLSIFLARSPGMPLDQVAGEATEDTWRSWVDRLVEHGALRVEDGNVIMTPLGVAAMREQLVASGVEVDVLPDAAELTADELASMAHAIPAAEMQQELSAWLAVHAPADAARELLAVAAEGDAVDRVWGTTVAMDLGAEEVWQGLLEHDTLRPYAKMALGQPVDHAERGWFVIDAVISALVLSDPVATMSTVLAPGDEEKLFDAMWRLPHPDAADVLAFIGESHPDKKLAKAARRAAHKAISREGG